MNIIIKLALPAYLITGQVGWAGQAETPGQKSAEWEGRSRPSTRTPTPNYVPAQWPRTPSSGGRPWFAPEPTTASPPRLPGRTFDVNEFLNRVVANETTTQDLFKNRIAFRTTYVAEDLT